MIDFGRTQIVVDFSRGMLVRAGRLNREEFKITRSDYEHFTALSCERPGRKRAKLRK